MDARRAKVFIRGVAIADETTTGHGLHRGRRSKLTVRGLRAIVGSSLPLASLLSLSLTHPLTVPAN